MSRLRSSKEIWAFVGLMITAAAVAGCNSSNASAPLNHSMDDAAATIESAGGRMDVHVDFAHAAIKDADLKTLPLPATTTYLNLSYTKVTDAGLAHLQRFPDLEELHVAGTEVSDAGLEHLMKLDKLRLIVADQSKISRKGQLKLIKLLAPRQQAHATSTGASKE